MTRVRPVILSGGSGTRLWPLSVESRPKQFQNVLGETTLFAATLGRALRLDDVVGVTVVTGGRHARLVEERVEGTGARVLVEPAPRNTAPAIVAAAMDADPEDVLVVLPSDHRIADVESFARAAALAVDLALDGRIVTFGCVPDRPEQGYGWIRPGDDLGKGFTVAEFVEKPERELARDLLERGFLWNSGMFVARASVILEEERDDELKSAVSRSLREGEGGVLSPAFLDAPSISFDRSVMEKTTEAAVVPLDAGWSDVGSWQAVWELLPKDDASNATQGRVHLIDSTGSFVRSTTKPVAVIGLDDVVVVETENGVLVVPRDRAQDVGEIGRILADDDAK